MNEEKFGMCLQLIFSKRSRNTRREKNCRSIEKEQKDMATTQGYPAYQPGQPVFSQPGTVPMANVAPPGAVMYSAQAGVMMVSHESMYS